MHVSCPNCQARVEIIPDSAPERVTCPSCGVGFAAAASAPDRAIALQTEAIQEKRGVPESPRALPANQRPGAGKVPWYLVVIGLVPFTIPAVAIPCHLLVGGALGGALWGGIGGGLAAACLAIARRTNWSRFGRVLAASGLALLSLLVLFAAFLSDVFLRAAQLGPPPHPVITVTAAYPGANAETVADTVAVPIEQQIVGVENMLSMRSRCSNDGSYVLNITFEHGTDLGMAQVLVQNRVSLAAPLLPQAVNFGGMRVLKTPANLLLLVKLFSPNRRHDTLFLSNYAHANLTDDLSRLSGVGEVTLLGQRAVETLLWLDADRLAACGLAVADVVRALEAQNFKAAEDPRAKGMGKGTRLRISSLGRLADVIQLEETIIKVMPDGRQVWLKDVAQVELRQGAMASTALLKGKPVVLLAIYPTLQARPREVSAAVQDTLGQLRAQLPAGIGLEVAFDFTPNLEAPGRATTPEYLLLDIGLPAGASTERIVAILKRCQASLDAVEGVQDSAALTDHPFDRVAGRPCVLVRLVPPGERAVSRQQIIEAIRTRFAKMADMDVRIRDLSRPGGFSRSRYPIELALEDRGNVGSARLNEVASKFAEQLRVSQQLSDVWVNPDSVPQPQIFMDVDRNAVRRHGVDVADIFAVLQAAGGAANDFNHFGRTWQVILPIGPRQDLEGVRNLVVLGGQGQRVPLSRLANVHVVQALPAINRHNLYPMAEITANLAPGVSLAEARRLCEARVGELQLPDGIRLVWLDENSAGFKGE